jgi:putative phosphoesterase
MRVATLYDLHGNVNALEAVLHEIPIEATIVVGGDVCAGGTHPSETLERLRALGERVVWLRGNADRELTPGGEKGLAPAEVIEATRSALTAEQIAFLHALPRTVQIDDMLFCHATPRNDLDIFTERTPEERIAHLFADVDADVVVCGHTHTQFERTIAEKRVINSGSVGMPYEDAPGAYWTLDLTHRRTEYDGAESPKIGREEAISHFEALTVGDCDDVPVPRVVRLLTLADVGDGDDARRISVSARHECSSPSEGLHKSPANGDFVLPVMARF